MSPERQLNDLFQLSPGDFQQDPLPETFEDLIQMDPQPPQASNPRPPPFPPLRPAGEGGKQLQNLIQSTSAPTATEKKLAIIKPRILTMKQRVEKQRHIEEEARKLKFRGDPCFDWGLQYRLLPEGNLYKISSYNRKTKTYRMKNLNLEKQQITVPFQYITAQLHHDDEYFAEALGQNLLREKQKNAQLQAKIKYLQKELNDARSIQNVIE